VARLFAPASKLEEGIFRLWKELRPDDAFAGAANGGVMEWPYVLSALLLRQGSQHKTMWRCEVRRSDASAS